MKYYFCLQFKLLKRRVITFGINPIVCCILVLLFFIYASLLIFSEITNPTIIYSIFAISCTTLLSSKNRNVFLKSIFTLKQYVKLRLLENALLVLPFAVFLGFKQAYNMAFFILIASSTFVFIKSNTNFNFTLPTPFYKNPFEFLVGFRSSFILIVALYMLMIISINVQNFGLGAFALFFLFFIIISFYQKPESVFYVWIYALNSKQFLIKKITIAIMHSFILTLPMLSGLIYFFPHYIAIIIAISLFGNILMITVLLSKYAQFPDALAPSKFLALIFSAWFPPLVIAFAIRFYLQSKKSLHTILK